MNEMSLHRRLKRTIYLMIAGVVGTFVVGLVFPILMVTANFYTGGFVVILFLMMSLVAPAWYFMVRDWWSREAHLKTLGLLAFVALNLTSYFYRSEMLKGAFNRIGTLGIYSLEQMFSLQPSGFPFSAAAQFVVFLTVMFSVVKLAFLWLEVTEERADNTYAIVQVLWLSFFPIFFGLAPATGPGQSPAYLVRYMELRQLPLAGLGVLLALYIILTLWNVSYRKFVPSFR